MALTVPVVDDELPDYGPLVLGSLNAAGVVLGGNAVATVLTANVVSVTTEIRFLWSIVPYVALVAEPDRFATVTTLATTIGAVALAGWLLVSSMRDSLDPLQRAGRLSALPMAAAMLAIQWSRLVAVDALGAEGVWLLASTALLAVAGAVAVRSVRSAFPAGDDRAADDRAAQDRAAQDRAADDAAAPVAAARGDRSVAPTPTGGFRRNLRSTPPTQEAPR